MTANWIVLSLVLLLAGSCMESSAQQTPTERKHFADIKAKADKGDAVAQLALGDLYLTGKGVSQDLGKAAKWHRKAAEQGLPRAEFQYGLDYANGYGVKMDKSEAASWIRAAAGHGLPEAQLACGYIYAKGEGVRVDAVEALKYFRQAADQNLPDAVYEVGKCYLEGNGVAKDVSEGVKWTRKAAELGCAAAQDRLGLCYMKGEGVSKDYLEAYKWLNLAAGHGEDQTYDFKVDLAKVETLMTPEQIAEAQRLAREFKAGTSASTDTAANASGTSRMGSVNVKADDDNCDILVDGAFVGNAPAKLKLSEGSHFIEVRKAGFKSYRKEIKVTDGAELTLRVALERQ